MSDPIEREDAINAALTFIVEYCGAAFDEDMQKMLCERLEKLPSAIPTPHGNLVDIDTMINRFWDGDYMEIHSIDLDEIPVIIEAEVYQ